MKTIRSMIAAGAFAAMSAIGFGATASAQDDDIVIRAPYAIHHERTASGEVVYVSSAITTGDLDLRSDYDVDVMHQRVTDTAWDVCQRALEALHGVSDTSDRECVRRAVREARAQERYQIERARG